MVSYLDLKGLILMQTDRSLKQQFDGHMVSYLEMKGLIMTQIDL